mgnify:CR=1 FL=1
MLGGAEPFRGLAEVRSRWMTDTLDETDRRDLEAFDADQIPCAYQNPTCMNPVGWVMVKSCGCRSFACSEHRERFDAWVASRVGRSGVLHCITHQEPISVLWLPA